MSFAQPIKGNLLSFNPDDNKIDLFPIETGFEQFVFINDQEIALFSDNGIYMFSFIIPQQEAANLLFWKILLLV
jgi:hypothetical protein